MRRIHFTPVANRGDTIVEVLLAMAVITSVLAGAFLVSQKSAYAVQDSQERGEMLQILQGQVEEVRALALQQHDDTHGVFDTTLARYFCINSSHAEEPFSSFSPLPSLDNDTYGEYPANCQINGRYNVAVSYDSSTHVFSFLGRWDKVGGGKSQEQLFYRIYPGS